MAHREIHSAIKDILRSKFTQPFSLLDLGCGDASFSAKTLSTTSVADYTGLDISDVALEHARKNLVDCSFRSTLRQDDFCKYVADLEAPVDVVLAGFSLHHLSLQEKKEFIRKCKRILKNNGLFLLLVIETLQIRRP